MTAPIRIGVNALYLIPGRVGGTEIYLRNVLNALAVADTLNQYFVFRNRETGPDLTPAAPNFYDCPQPFNASSRPARILYEQTAFPLACLRCRIDVLFNAGFTAPLLAPCPMATVFHDLQYIRHPAWFRRFDLPFWRVLLPLSAKRSRRLIALSSAVQSDLQTYYRFPADRIDLIPHGVEPTFNQIAARRFLNPPAANQLLTVSTLHPHKNLDTLLTAFHRFLALPGSASWQLTIAGLKGFEAERIEALRRSLQLESAVTLAGWIPREQLYDLFASASAFIYPSRFEGFGIPVLEALAVGIPTACSRIPSLEEIAADAARFFDPGNPNDLLAALIDVTSNEPLRARLTHAGPARAALFSWDRSAAKLIQSFRATLSKNSQD